MFNDFLFRWFHKFGSKKSNALKNKKKKKTLLNERTKIIIQQNQIEIISKDFNNSEYWMQNIKHWI
jgi:hypothetical protein